MLLEIVVYIVVMLFFLALIAKIVQTSCCEANGPTYVTTPRVARWLSYDNTTDYYWRTQPPLQISAVQSSYAIQVDDISVDCSEKDAPNHLPKSP
jgi:hypothetical protein